MNIKERDVQVLNIIKSWAKNVIENAKKHGYLFLELPSRGYTNIIWDEEKGILRMGSKKVRREFLNVRHSKRFLQTAVVAEKIKRLMEENATSSLRDLYYQVKFTIPGTNEDLVYEQNESDRAVQDLETMWEVLREDFHIYEKGAKGRAVGPFKLKEYVQRRDGSIKTVEVDGTEVGMGGWAIPNIVEPSRVEITKVDADFVLVIEKEAVWSRFHEDEFWNEHNAIIVTGSGMPDRATRRFVQRLHQEFGLPVYVMTDADPWGWYIYSVYKRGSMNLSYISDLVSVPEAKFLGLTISDFYDFNLRPNVKIKLTDRDIKRLNEIKDYPWFKQKEWQKEFSLMLKENFKMELEALSSKYTRFITKEYVPQKLEEGKLLP